MKVVLDTNVLLSGIFFSGAPYQVLQAWQAGRFSLVLSREILEEYHRTAQEMARSFPGIDVGSLLGLIERQAEFVEAPALEMQVCADPDDDKFLACALASGASLVVSGDKHLLKVSGFGGIQVLRPRAFLDTLLD